MNSRKFFDEIAGEWDEMRPRFYSNRVREKAVDITGINPGLLAADLGAGTGFVTEALLRNGLQVVAIDQSEAMLESMRAKFERFDTIEYRLGSAENLPLADETVDYVFGNMYLHHVESPPAAIAEMTRILKPGGRLTLTDVFAHGFEFLRPEHYDRWLGFVGEDLEKWFAAAGLEEVRVQDIDEECRVVSGDHKTEAVMNIFAATGTKRGSAP